MIGEPGVSEHGQSSEDGSDEPSTGSLEQSESLDEIDETTLRPLLLHSLHELREVWLPLLDLFERRAA